MFLFISTLAAALIAFLGFLAFLHGGKSVTNKVFFVHTLVIAAWSIVNYVSVAINPAYALPWIRLVITLAVPHIFLFFFFVLNFPNEKLAVKKKNLSYLMAWMLLLGILALTPLVFKKVNIVDSKAVPEIGPLMPYFAVTLLLVSIVTFVLIIRKYFHSKGIEKAQWRGISLGLVFSYTCIFSFIFLPVILYGDTSLVSYSPLFVLPIFIGSAYAILRHGFLSIKVIATEIFTFFLLFMSVWQVLLAPNLVFQVLQGSITVFLLVFSVFLIRSVLLEIRQREQLQELSKQLADANDQLKLLDQAKSEFLSVASHQLRTPLTAIKGYASMFMEGDFGKITDNQMKNIKMIEESANRLTVLVSDLLDLSRIESGRMEFDFEGVDLCKVVEDVLEEVAPKAKAKALYIYFDNVNRACPKIRADKEKLRQVVINLVDNAIKYTLHGGVTVRVLRSGSNLEMSITDSGIGIDPKDYKKIFEKFFRSEQASEVTSEGTGLGIYVAKKIVDAQGGKMRFESPGVGKGTTFYVSFPIPEGKIKEERVKVASIGAF